MLFKVYIVSNLAVLDFPKTRLKTKRILYAFYVFDIFIALADFGRGQNVATGSPVCLDFANGTKVGKIFSSNFMIF